MGEWIEWGGGGCPVGDATLVDLRYRDNTVAWGVRLGDDGAFRWDHIGNRYDIVAYRLSTQEEAYEETEKPIGDSAQTYLIAAAKHMDDRAATYDKPEGERSITQVVAIFNLFHGTKLTEAQGWHFMEIVKKVRFFTANGFHRDSVEDAIAYSALMGEAKQREGV